MNRRETDEAAKRLARRNVRLALLLGVIALGFFLVFFWTMSHR